MSKLLINEEPLVVLPSLAKAIGINHAIVLQQVHYWIGKKIHLHDGKYWTYNTLKEWQKQFPHLTVIGLKKIIKKLEDMNLLISNQYNKNKFDHTKWYTINYETLDSYKPPIDEVLSIPSDEVLSIPSEEVLSIPSINTENTKNNYTESKGVSHTHKDKDNINRLGEFENVLLSNNEVRKLNDRFSSNVTQKSISMLSETFKADPTYERKRKNHYATILKWVIEAVLKSNPPQMLTKEQMAECEKKYSLVRKKYKYNRTSENYTLI